MESRAAYPCSPSPAIPSWLCPSETGSSSKRLQAADPQQRLHIHRLINDYSATVRAHHLHTAFRLPLVSMIPSFSRLSDDVHLRMSAAHGAAKSSSRQLQNCRHQHTNHERHHELVEWWGDAHYDPGDVDAANFRKNVEALAAKWRRRSRKKN